MGQPTLTGAAVAVLRSENGGTASVPDDKNGAGYRAYLQSPREEQWLPLHERQTWGSLGAFCNDATGWSFEESEGYG